MDTSNILFICGGAFSGLDKIILNRSQKSGIGFVADVKSQDTSDNIGHLLKDVEPEDLIKYGLIPEFVGRLPVVATLEELDEDALVRILVEPKNALTKQYQKLFEMESVELELREDALRAVAQRAMKRKDGRARLADDSRERLARYDVRPAVDEERHEGRRRRRRGHGRDETVRDLRVRGAGGRGRRAPLRIRARIAAVDRSGTVIEAAAVGFAGPRAERRRGSGALRFAV